MEIPDLEGRADPVVFAKLGSVEDFYYYYYYYLNYIQSELCKDEIYKPDE